MHLPKPAREGIIKSTDRRNREKERLANLLELVFALAEGKPNLQQEVRRMADELQKGV